MKNWMKFLLVITVITVIFVAGCKDDTTEPEVTAFETVLEYMDNNGMEIGDLLSEWIIPAVDIVDNLQDYYIMDIRSADYHGATVADSADGTPDYQNGHIPGAVASSFGNIVVDAAASGRSPIIVVCYTGQSAGHAVMALRLSGYPDAKVLKWGMSGWNADFDKWSGNCTQLDHANWIAPEGNIAANEEFDYPTLDTDLEDGAEILTERVSALLSAFNSVLTIDVLDAPSSYFINNYWGEGDVINYGNIDTAYRINPLVLNNLDPNGIVVTYCWTGQTSSMVTAYLKVLGYDSKSLKFGANSMIYDALNEHKWSASADYDYDTGR